MENKLLQPRSLKRSAARNHGACSNFAVWLRPALGSDSKNLERTATQSAIIQRLSAENGQYFLPACLLKSRGRFTITPDILSSRCLVQLLAGLKLRAPSYPMSSRSHSPPTLPDHVTARCPPSCSPLQLQADRPA